MIKISKQHEKNEMRKIQMTEKQEFWDIYNEKKERTGRTMKRNDWCLKDGEYHHYYFTTNVLIETLWNVKKF